MNKRLSFLQAFLCIIASLCAVSGTGAFFLLYTRNGMGESSFSPAPEPVAKVAEYELAAIDTRGRLIPLPSSRIPFSGVEIRLTRPSESTMQWEETFPRPNVELAFAVLRLFQTAISPREFQLERIDVSQAMASNPAEREIVIRLKERTDLQRNGVIYRFLFPRLLRLSPEGYKQQLANYVRSLAVLPAYVRCCSPSMKPDKAMQQIFPVLWQGEKKRRRRIQRNGTPVEERIAPLLIIDMRIDRLAFIKQVE